MQNFAFGIGIGAPGGGGVTAYGIEMLGHPIEIEADAGLLFGIGDATDRVLQVNDMVRVRIDRADIADGIFGPIFPPTFASFGPFVPARVARFARQWSAKKFFFEWSVGNVSRTK